MICSVVLLGFLTPNLPAEDKVLGKTKDQWIEVLKSDPEPRKRRAAVIALRISGPTQRDISRALQEALRTDKEAIVRRQILQVLLELRPDELRDWLPGLVEILKSDPQIELKVLSLNVLGKMDELAKPALSNLIAACKEPDVLVRSAAVDALGRLNAEPAAVIPTLALLLKDTDPTVKLASLLALTRMGPDAVELLPTLQSLLPQEKLPEIRKQIFVTIGAFGESAKGAIPDLLQILKTEFSEELRQQLVQTLSKFGQTLYPQLPALKAIYQADKDVTTRMYLVRLIADLEVDHPKALADQYSLWLDTEKDTEVRKVMIEEIGALGKEGTSALPALKKAQRDVQVSVRDAANHAIRRITQPVDPKSNP
jgi:HEAT repeat protein